MWGDCNEIVTLANKLLKAEGKLKKKVGEAPIPTCC